MISIATAGNTIKVTAPANADFARDARGLGGTKQDGTWTFPKHRETHVRRLLASVYGTTGDDGIDLVTARVDLAAYATKKGTCYDKRIILAGRTIAGRAARDSQVGLGKGVIRTSGRWELSGGSVANPAVGDVTGVVLEVEGVPSTHPDLSRPGVTIMEPAAVDEQSLLAERERLLARIAEIDAMLPPPPAAEVTTRQAAEALGVSVRTVQRWAAQGKVQATKGPRGQWVITITITAKETS